MRIELPGLQKLLPIYLIGSEPITADSPAMGNKELFFRELEQLLPDRGIQVVIKVL